MGAVFGLFAGFFFLITKNYRFKFKLWLYWSYCFFCNFYWC
jgi:hypothetical protein